MTSETSREIDVETGRYLVSGLTGEFLNRSMEQEFSKSVRAEENRRLRITLLVGGAAFFLAGLVDVQAIGSDWRTSILFICRFSTLMMALAIVLMTLRPGYVSSLPIALFSLQLVVGSVFLLAVFWQGNSGEGGHSFVSSLLIVLTFYLFIPGRAALTIISSTVVSVGVLVISSHFHFHQGALLVPILCLLAANILGAAFRRNHNRARRCEYVSMDCLRRLNVRLEKAVKQRSALEEKAVRSGDNLRTVFEFAPIPMCLEEVTTGRLLRINRAFSELFSLSPDDAEGLAVEQLFWEEKDRIRFLRRMASTGRCDEMDVTMRSCSGKKLEASLSAKALYHRELPCFIMTVTDMRDARRLEAQLREMATTDALTGTLNRRAFFERARTEVNRTRRHGTPVSLLMLDLDHFKSVNDQYGHAAGDDTLCTLVEVIGSILRDEDVLARFGGEEFIVLLPQTGCGSAGAAGERIRRRVEETRMGSSAATFKVTVSVGVSCWKGDGDGLEKMIERADRALYRAKNDGRNLVRLQRSD